MALLHLATLCLAAAPLPQGEPPLPPDHTGLLYVSGFNSNNVVELAPDGTLLRTFGTADTRQPRGVSVDDRGQIVVVCQGSDRIQLFDRQGGLVREVVHSTLTSGTGLSRSAGGDWYVGNFSPGRVLRFDADWNHVATITHPSMAGVNCVSFEADGTFSVTDAFNGSVHRIDAAGNHTAEIDHPSLISPMSLARDSAGDHYVSNGGGLISKFDANWSFLFSFGQGHVSQPQGVVVDEHDVLTVTNFSSSDVNRFDTSGTHLETFPLLGATTGRNATFQYSPYALAIDGDVRDASGAPTALLTVNGTKGDGEGRVTLSATDPLTVDLALPPGVTGAAPAMVFAWVGAPLPATVTELPSGLGLLARTPAFLGGRGELLTNSLGRGGVVGPAQGAPLLAPARLVDLPGGIGRGMTVTLQGLVAVPGGTVEPTNAVVLEIL